MHVKALVQSAHGTMWEARSSPGSVMLSHRAAAASVIHQRVPKNVLADALDDHALCFGRSG
jgi:hypothetical protein